MRITQHPDGTITIDTGGRAAKEVAVSGDTVAGRIFKADAAQRKTWHVFYPANKADVAVAMDGHRDFAGKAAVEKAAHDYLLKHRKVGLLHADGTDGSGDLVESGIHHGPDWVMKAADGTEQRVLDGDWTGAIQWDVPTWERWEKGELRGVSPQGGALRADASDEALAGLRKGAGDAVKGDVEITELVEFEVTRVDGVVSPANGFPVLMMKGLGDPDGAAKAGDGDAVECPTCKGDGKILGNSRDCPDCGAKGTVSPAKAKELASKAAGVPEAVPGKPCPTCGQKVDGSVVRAHVRRKKAGQDAAKAVVERILKAVVDGKVDEDPDVKGGTAVLEQIADLIIAEAQELKAGQAGEIEDIEQLACAAGLIWSWRTGEEAAGSGSVMPATVLMASAAAKADLSTKELNDLPDSAFAYVEPGGKKDSGGKTVPRSKRHFAIHDKAHADNSAARIAQGAEFGEQAAAKVKAAQKKFGEDASKSQIANGETTVDTETGNDGQIAKAVEDALAKALAPVEKLRKELEETLAKVRNTPIPGGPVLSANVQVKRPGGVLRDDELAAKAALYREKAAAADAPGDRAAYLALARETDEQARKAAAPA